MTPRMLNPMVTATAIGMLIPIAPSTHLPALWRGAKVERDAAERRSRARDALRRRRRAPQLRALRPLPLRLPDLRRARHGGGLAARAHPSHAGDGGGAPRAVARGRSPSGSLPRLPRVRDGVSVGGPLRAAGGGSAAVRRAPPPAPGTRCAAGARGCAHRAMASPNAAGTGAADRRAAMDARLAGV